jgi:hypothetical protein
MHMAGASPDAIVANRDTGSPVAVFEAKCKVPFYRQDKSEPALLYVCHVPVDALC